MKNLRLPYEQSSVRNYYYYHYYLSFFYWLVSEMTYTVSSGTLNSTIPYHTILLLAHTRFMAVEGGM